MNKDLKQNIEISSTQENISLIEKFVDDYLQNISIGDELYGKIYLATIEAANNAVNHGNKRNPRKKVFLQMEKNNNELVIDIHDMGEGFDYLNLPDPTLPENIEKPNGRGIFIIANLADKLLFNEKGNEIKITFNLN